MPKPKISIDLPEDALAISWLGRQEAGDEMRGLFLVSLVRPGAALRELTATYGQPTIPRNA